jgi:hypothetical protein
VTPASYVRAGRSMGAVTLERPAEGDYAAVQHDHPYERHTCHALHSSKAYPGVSYPAGRGSSCSEAPQTLNGSRAPRARRPRIGLVKAEPAALTPKFPSLALTERLGQGQRGWPSPPVNRRSADRRLKVPDCWTIRRRGLRLFQVGSAVSFLAAQMRVLAPLSGGGGALTGLGISPAEINILTLDY